MEEKEEEEGPVSSGSRSDYYTTEMLHQIWHPEWFDLAFRYGDWCATVDAAADELQEQQEQPTMNPIDPSYQTYHPYACHACKRGALTKTKLFTCQGCKVIKYCSRDHQKSDWKNHRMWCKAFSSVRRTTSMNFSNREEWSRSIVPMTRLINTHMPLQRHSLEVQIPLLQPRCRECYKAECATPGLNLMVCPRCGGVAVCEACLAGRPNRDSRRSRRRSSTVSSSSSSSSSTEQWSFHLDTIDNDPRAECDAHRLSLSCAGMIVEQGNPLGMPSETDAAITTTTTTAAAALWNPKDWIEYFRIKRHDFDMDARMFVMAPVVAFLSDAHSTVLSIHHILSRPESGVHPSTMKHLVVHICGADRCDVDMPGRYVELTRLNPQLETIAFHFIGPNISSKYAAVMMNQGIARERIRPTCSMTIQCHQGYYHHVAPNLTTILAATGGADGTDTPDTSCAGLIVVCPHSGLADVSYTKEWKPSMEYILEQNLLLVLTGYNHEEIMDDSDCLEQWGARIVIPPCPNPFRGLRPFLDPGRKPNDVIYTNAAFVVAKGKKKDDDDSGSFQQ